MKTENDKKIRAAGIVMLLLFFIIMIMVVNGVTQNFDEDVIKRISENRIDGLNTLMELLTQAGSLSAVVVICLLLLAFEETRQVGLRASVLTALAWGCNFLVKNIVARQRSMGSFAIVRETGFSFPSGHTCAAVALFASLVYMMLQLKKKGGKPFLPVPLLTAVPVAVAISRVYLGVHFPTDVIGAAAEALAFVFIAMPWIDKLSMQLETIMEKRHIKRHDEGIVPIRG